MTDGLVTAATAAAFAHPESNGVSTPTADPALVE